MQTRSPDDSEGKALDMAPLATEYVLTIASVLLLLAVLAGMASSRLGVPALVLFLFLGMLAGTDGPGHINFNDAWLAQLLGVISLTLILFESGLNTHWPGIRPLLAQGLSLATLGVVATSLLVGLFASQTLHLPWLYGLLLGAVVSSTDAAAVLSVLKAGSAQLKGPLQPLLELESSLNDPMAVCLTVGLLHLIQEPSLPFWSLVPLFLQQMSVGLIVGVTLGKAMVWLLNRAVRLEYEGLYAVFTLALALFAYGFTVILGGSGFLAVYIAALMMGNAEFGYKKSLIRFHESLAWLMQIVMFLTLGLLALPSRLPHIMVHGLLISAFLILAARPISVFLSLHFTTLSVREKLMISWVGLRGAVPIILATFPLLEGLPQATLFFDIVFFIALTSVLLQGTTLTYVARFLGVNSSATRKPRIPLEFVPAGISRNDLVEVPLAPGSFIIGRSIADLALPREVLIVLVCRGEEFLVPNGSTVLETDDTLLVLAEKEQLEQFCLSVGTCQPI